MYLILAPILFAFLSGHAHAQSRLQFQTGVYSDNRPTCQVSPHERRECGYPGISLQLCYQRSCCFNNAQSQYGVPECFLGLNDNRSPEEIQTEIPRPTDANGLPAPAQGSIFNQNSGLSAAFPTSPPSDIDVLISQLGISAKPTKPTRKPVTAKPGETVAANSQCSIVQFIADTNPDLATSLREQLGCTGDETALSEDQINAGASSLLESFIKKTTTEATTATKATSTTEATTTKPTPSTPSLVQNLLNSLTGGEQPVTSSSNLINELLGNNVEQVGGMKPNFGPGGSIDTGPPTEPPICATIKDNSDFSKLAPLLGCQIDVLKLITQNLIGQFSDATEITSLPPGAIDPAKIPSSILLDCVEKRDTYADCKQGLNRNILTDTECFNLGCIPFEYMCFRCLKVPKSALITLIEEETCAVAESDREQCDGFSNIALINALSGTQSPLSSLTGQTGSGGINSLLPFLLGGGGTGSSSSLNSLLPLLLAGGGGTGGAGGLGSVLPLLLAGDGLGGSGSSDGLGSLLPLLLGGGLRSGQVTPKARAGIEDLFGSSSASSALSLLGGGGGLNPQTLLLQQLLGSSSSTTTTTPSTLSIEEQFCRSRKCCYTKATGIQAALGLGGACYKRGKQTLSSSGSACEPSQSSGSCGREDGLQNSKFGGGFVSDIKDRPWQALIMKGTAVKCSGAVICQNWILTAASCLVRIALNVEFQIEVPAISSDTVTVITGTLDVTGAGGLTHTVEQITPHPQFNFRQNFNNIAAIRIRRTTLSSTFQPLCLPSLGNFAIEEENKIVQVAGYGQSGPTGGNTNLEELEMKIMSQSSCSSAYPGGAFSTNSGIFCALSQNTNKDVCYGDAGAPAVQYDSATSSYHLVGINFGGSENCDGTKPGLFTSISRFRDWIRSTTNGCCSLPGQF